jgi:hypothetical protein
MSWLVPAIEGATAVAKSGLFSGSNQGGGRAHRRNVRQWWRELAATERFRTEDYQRQKEFAQEGTGWQFDDLMEAADQAGIHRLAALGGAQGAAYSPGASVGSAGAATPTGPGPSTGDAIGDALEGIMEAMQWKERKKAADASVERTEAETANIQAQTELYKAQSRTAINNARNGRDPRGSEGNPEQLMQRIQMPDGSIREIPIGYDLDEVLTGLGIYYYDKVRDIWAPVESRANPKRQRGTGGIQTKIVPQTSTKTRRPR